MPVFTPSKTARQGLRNFNIDLQQIAKEMRRDLEDTKEDPRFSQAEKQALSKFNDSVKNVEATLSANQEALKADLSNELLIAQFHNASSNLAALATVMRAAEETAKHIRIMAEVFIDETRKHFNVGASIDMSPIGHKYMDLAASFGLDPRSFEDVLRHEQLQAFKHFFITGSMGDGIAEMSAHHRVIHTELKGGQRAAEDYTVEATLTGTPGDNNAPRISWLEAPKVNRAQPLPFAEQLKAAMGFSGDDRGR